MACRRRRESRAGAGEQTPGGQGETGGGKACAWCDYATLCRAKDGPGRSYPSQTNREVLKELEQK